jgi:methionyl aminopeptidase
MKWKKCHYPDPGPLNQDAHLGVKEHYLKKYGIFIKEEDAIQKIRRSCQLAAQILQKTCEQARAGVTTLELNDYAHRLTLEAGAIPAALHYGRPPFPKSICTSINDVVCHGIPDSVPLKEGDILNVDYACILNGFFGDCSQMVCIGEVNQEKKHVVKVAYDCLQLAIEVCKPGIPLSEIGKVIETHAHASHCSVVNKFVGHGVGLRFHEEPQVPHYRNSIHIPLVPGMIFTIEPMINAGVRELSIDSQDHWTARTLDGKPSAQWEHTILITNTGHEILTILSMN